MKIDDDENGSLVEEQDKLVDVFGCMKETAVIKDDIIFPLNIEWEVDIL